MQDGYLVTARQQSAHQGAADKQRPTDDQAANQS
jgi:hypothetical protein